MLSTLEHHLKFRDFDVLTDGFVFHDTLESPTPPNPSLLLAQTPPPSHLGLLPSFLSSHEVILHRLATPVLRLCRVRVQRTKLVVLVYLFEHFVPTILISFT